MTSRRILLLFFILLAAGGAASAILGLLWPARYAKALLTIDREFRENPTAPRGVVKQVPSQDPAQALRLAAEQRAFLMAIRGKIADLRPAPPRYRQLQEDLEAGADFFLMQNAEIERRIEFIARAKELDQQVRRALPTTTDVVTVGDALAVIDREVPRLKTSGDVLFQGELPQAPEIAEMKTAWAEAVRGLDTLVAALRREPRERSFRDAAAALTTPELREAERALERFLELLRDAASSSVGSVFGSSSLASPPPDVSARLSRIGAALDEFRQRYPEGE